MNTDIRRGRDFSKNITFKELWMKDQFYKLRRVYSKEEVSNEEIRKLLEESYGGRKLIKGRLYNNMNHSNEAMTQEQFVDLFLNKPYVLSGYATLYEDQKTQVNIGSAALSFLLDSRKTFKTKMEESEYGSDQYTYYKILQLTYKVLANSYYGILGERNSVFYNPHVQNSITMTGQDLITTTIISLENFLADNVSFKDFDDVVNFVNNALLEKYEHNILNYIDDPISKKQLSSYFESKTKSKLDSELIDSVISKLDAEQLSRVYYKNKVLELLENSWFKNKLKSLVKFKYLENPEEKMVESLREFSDLIKQFCFTNMLFEDRYKRSMKDERKNIVASDTDSAFINLNNYIVSITAMIDLDKSDTVQQMTVMNIFVSIITDIMEKIFDTMTEHMGMPQDYKNIINLKNEFLYKRIMLTRNKKSYAGIITGELGRLLKNPVLDIKGLSIRKTNMPKKLRDELTEILLRDVLSAEKIDLKKIITEFDRLGKGIEQSLKKGEITYSIPRSLEQFDKYKMPSTIEPLRGVLVWNAIEPENVITPPEKVNIVKLKGYDKGAPEIEKIKLTHPDKYKALMKTVFNEGVTDPKIDISRFGLSVLTVPKSAEKIPDYILPMIDYQSMVNTNMSNGYIILESLGVYIEEVSTNRYKSNVVEI
jgi:arsenate reductase-like glutaredoxin family protein